MIVPWGAVGPTTAVGVSKPPHTSCPRKEKKEKKEKSIVRFAWSTRPLTRAPLLTNIPRGRARNRTYVELLPALGGWTRSEPGSGFRSSSFGGMMSCRASIVRSTA